MALQQNYTHVYATAIGQFASNSAWAGEVAMVGWRIACWPTLTDIKLIADLPLRGGLQPKLHLETHTNYNVVQKWDDGGPGGMQYWDLGAQMDVCDAIRGWMTAVKARQSTLFTWTHVKLAPIAADGSYAQGSTEFNFTEAGKIAGAVSTLLPPEVAIASSYGASVPGRGGRSRVYLPALAQTCIGTDGTVSSTVAGIFNNAQLALFADVKANVGLPGAEYRVVSTSAAATRYVLPQSVWVGSHADAQRRRQHQSVENKWSLPIPQ